jgi:5'-hydroxyaverantin dehydrogenase
MTSAIHLSRALSAEDANRAAPGSSLKDKSILITEGASGLGAGTALVYAEKG